jgi:flavin-dependent dehydrogenase
VVVGGGVAGVYGAIHAKTIVPHLNVAIIVKGKPLSKVCDCILFVLTAYE